MVEQQQAAVAVRQTVVVDAPRERAFAVFTERMTAWWPLQTHTIGANPAIEAVIEPREGGRTRVELEHRGLEAYAERAEEMRGIFDSDGGWRGLLARFADAAAAD